MFVYGSRSRGFRHRANKAGPSGAGINGNGGIQWKNWYLSQGDFKRHFVDKGNLEEKRWNLGGKPPAIAGSFSGDFARPNESPIGQRIFEDFFQ